MKRFIIIECNDKMSTMFVAVHEGESVCMTPLLADSMTERHQLAVRAIPAQNIVECPLSKAELLPILDKYLFHEDWPGDRDWQGNRIHDRQAESA